MVSTDCPSGPYEILAPEFKRYLTKVNNIESFTLKVDETLEEESVAIPSSLLKPFAVQTVLKQYIQLFRG